MIVFIDSRQPCVEIYYGNLVDLFLETNLSFGIFPISMEITLFQRGDKCFVLPPHGDAHAYDSDNVFHNRSSNMKIPM
jgi:hypothetical protein